MTQDLHSLTYISIARDDLAASELADIHCCAMHLNALDGVTGLLVFNGTHFMQVIEGAESAIDDLLARLIKDRRHHDIDIRDRRVIEKRFFADWSMDLLCISGGGEVAHRMLARELPKDLPPPVLEAVLAVAGEKPRT